MFHGAKHIMELSNGPNHKPEVMKTEQPVVYIDVLFVVNLALNYFVLLAVSALLHRKDRRLRLFAAACLGAVYSCLVFFPPLRFLYWSVSKILVSVLLVFAAYRFSGVRSFLKLLLFFYGVNIAFGGILYALWTFFSPPGMLYRNGVVYFDIQPLVLILAGGGCYAILLLFSRFLHRGAKPLPFSRLEIAVDGKSVRMTALLDTGNALCDMMTGDPVLIAEYKRVEPLIPVPLRDSFRKGCFNSPEMAAKAGWEGRLRMLPFHSVGRAEGILPAFRPDRVTAENNGKKIMTANVLVAVSPRKLSADGGCGALLNPHLFTEIRAD